MADGVDDLLAQAAEARRAQHPADARRALLAAVALGRAQGLSVDLARALTGLGQLERDLGDGETARRCYEEAVGLYRGAGEPSGLAHALRHLGDVHREEGRRDLATPCAREALALYRGDARTAPLDLANALRSLALLEEDAGQERLLWAEARPLYEAVGVGAGVAECLRRLARRT